MPILETLTFTHGQHRGDSVCVGIEIIPDIFVEADEVFEVMLLSNSLVAVIQSGKDRAAVTIVDGGEGKSMDALYYRYTQPIGYSLYH